MVSFNKNVQIVNFKYSFLLKCKKNPYKIIIFIKLACNRLTDLGCLSEFNHCLEGSGNGFMIGKLEKFALY